MTENRPPTRSMTIVGIKSNIHMVDWIVSNPFEKMKKFGDFPFKIICHILLIVFTSLQVYYFTSYNLAFSRGDIRYFYYLFFEDSDPMRYSDPNAAKEKYFFKTDDLQQFIKKSINKYYEVEENKIGAFENFLLIKDEKDQIKQVKIEADLDPQILEESDFQFNTQNDTTSKNERNVPKAIYFADKINHSIFDYPTEILRQYFHACTQIKITYELIWTKIFTRTKASKSHKFLHTECYHWIVWQIIDFKENSSPKLSISTLQNFCSENIINGKQIKYSLNETPLLIHISVIFCSIVSFYLGFEYIYYFFYIYSYLQEKLKANTSFFSSNRKVYQEIHKSNSQYINMFNIGFGKLELFRRYSKEKTSPGKINKKEKQVQNSLEKKNKRYVKHPLQALDFWNIISILGNSFQFFGASISIYEPKNRGNFKYVLVGIGCFLSWVNLVRYLQFNKSYFFLFATLFRSASVAGKYLIGIMPIFLGFGFLGCSLFWRSPRFSCLSNAFFSQFALLNGDMVYDSYKDLNGISKVATNIYLYCFIILFMCGVQNLLISIFQSFFAEVKKESEKEKNIQTFKKLQTKGKFNFDIPTVIPQIKFDGFEVPKNDEIGVNINKGITRMKYVHNNILNSLTNLYETFTTLQKVTPKEKEDSLKDQYRALLKSLGEKIENDFIKIL